MDQQDSEHQAPMIGGEGAGEEPEDLHRTKTMQNVRAASRVARTPTAVADETLAQDAAEAAGSGVVMPPRYRDLGVIGSGGFGDVRRVHDLVLDRVVAMKILRRDVGDAERVRARFLEEAKLTAGLQHPGIVAVHDGGRLDDGRLWYTMPEVRGRTLREIIDEAHAAPTPSGHREAGAGWTFRRMIDAFARACQAVAYAHRQGVVHRDLKPANVMVGELGEVLVMDWGIGRRIARAAPPPSLDPLEAQPPSSAPSSPAPASRPAPELTLDGDVLGTPAYMPPEQARGDHKRHGPASDVYALGAILYHALAGRPPYEGTVLSVLGQVLSEPPTPVVEAARGKPVPLELAAICERAMRRPIEERYPDAESLAREVLAWLDGERRREQALAVVAEARAMEPEIAGLRAEAARLRSEAQSLLAEARSFDPAARKQPGWALEDDAARLEVAAVLRETEWRETLRGALTVDPDLPEAHAMLSDHYRDRLIEAERARRDEDAVRFEAQLRAHDRGRHASLLRGEGALTIVTEPPGAAVLLERNALRQRRLVPEAVKELGRTPLRGVPLQRGSYRLRIRAPGRAEVRYPVLIERGAHWDGCAPGEREPTPIHLPAEGELGPDDVYVPAGWCWLGGDPDASDSLPAARIWVDAFILRRFPVTNAEYLAFLNDLVASGREDEAFAACPRGQAGIHENADARLHFRRTEGGRFLLGEDELGYPSAADMPVALIDWHAASAYASWLSARTGSPWRLPNELEREKAARGVDGRACPWGDFLDASFACVIESYEQKPRRASVDSYPDDESPYGARGLAGNTRDWCLNGWWRTGPPVDGGRLRIEEPPAGSAADYRAVRGGAWSSPIDLARSAVRFGAPPGTRRLTVGVRVARSYAR
ncbi:bifunctional serine/threonine-protein kinase/formylglycine-generating enzyme family protein [Sorangium sp. So ce834]|uniref:SUMF1/EgtB/PvdO family nonheme iron enzyme n=1 Tax=Sorangium sp. So ce834 TaxID=3133321 RepID=UPI003F5EA7CA